MLNSISQLQIPVQPVIRSVMVAQEAITQTAQLVRLTIILSRTRLTLASLPALI